MSSTPPQAARIPATQIVTCERKNLKTAAQIPTLDEINDMSPRRYKNLENRLRREAKLRGFLLRRNRSRDRSAENYGLYVLIGDSRGNRVPGAAAAPIAFWRGEGNTLDRIAEELRGLSA